MSVIGSSGGKNESQIGAELKGAKPKDSPSMPTAKYLLAKSRTNVRHLERRALKSGISQRPGMALKDRLDRCRSRQLSGSGSTNRHLTSEPSSGSELDTPSFRETDSNIIARDVKWEPTEERVPAAGSLPVGIRKELTSYIELLSGSTQAHDSSSESISVESSRLLAPAQIKKEPQDTETIDIAASPIKDSVSSTTSPAVPSPPENWESLNALWDVCQDEERIKQNIETSNDEIADMQRSIAQRSTERIQLQERLEEIRNRKRQLLGLKVYDVESSPPKQSFKVCESVIDQHINSQRKQKSVSESSSSSLVPDTPSPLDVISEEEPPENDTVRESQPPPTLPKSPTGISMTYLGMLETNPDLIKQLKKYIQVKQILAPNQ